MWDEKLASYIQITLSHDYDPYNPISVMECPKDFERWLKRDTSTRSMIPTLVCRIEKNYIPRIQNCEKICVRDLE